MEIKINFDASNPKNVEALNVFLKALSGESSEKEIPVVAAEVVEPKEVKKKEKPKAEKAKVEEPIEKQEEKPETVETKSESGSEEKITLDMIRPLLQTKVQLHRDAIKSKLSELGANNATSLDEEHYVEFYEFLTEL
jgi:hypothetical protein